MVQQMWGDDGCQYGGQDEIGEKYDEKGGNLEWMGRGEG
jgi:hypothetical protein